MTATSQSERLPAEVFRLPVERIRNGWYSDAYFVNAKTLLEEDEHHPRVLMQVFQKEGSLCGGIDEALAVLQIGAGTRAPTAAGSTAGPSSRSTRWPRATRSPPRRRS